MASQDQHSSKFKAKVALEALERDKKNLEPLSDKYDVPVSIILTWAVQLERNAEQIYASTSAPSDIETPEERSEGDTIVDIEISDPDISESIGFGAMHDDLDYKTLLYWTAMGVVFIVVFAQLIKYMYGQAGGASKNQVNSEATYYQVDQQKEEARNRISNFGVVDLDKGTYRVPIDAIINQMAVENDSTVNTK